MKIKWALRKLANGKLKFIWVITPVMAQDSYKLKSGEKWVTYKPNGDDAKGRHCVINVATGEITQGNPAIKGKNIDKLPHKKHIIPEEKYQRWKARQEKKTGGTVGAGGINASSKSQFFEHFTGIPDDVQKIEVAETAGLKLKDGTPCTITTRRPSVNGGISEIPSSYRTVHTLKINGELTPEIERELKNSGAKYDAKKDEWTVATAYDKNSDIKAHAEFAPNFFGDDTFSDGAFSEEFSQNITSHEYTRDMTKEKPPEPFTAIPGISDSVTDMEKKTWDLTIHNTTGRAILYSTDDGANTMVIDFDDFPSGDSRQRIKEAGFKWDPALKLWYKQGDNSSSLYEDIADASHKIGEQGSAKKETYRRENRLGGYGEEGASPEFIRKVNKQSLDTLEKAFGNNWDKAKAHIKNFHGVPVVFNSTSNGVFFIICSKHLDKATQNTLKDIGLSPSHSPSAKVQNWAGHISIDKSKLEAFIKNHISDLDSTQKSLLNK